MDSLASYSFTLVGKGLKLIGIGDCLLLRNQEIRGVFNADPVVWQWANNNNIEVLATLDVRHESDLLFNEKKSILLSLDNPLILTDDIVAQYDLCINCHNSLLPNYGGIQPVTWAILTGGDLGITYHRVNLKEGIDKGTILLQQKLTISSSNHVNYITEQLTNLAVQIFPQLLEKILQGGDELASVSPSALELTQQCTYYGVKDVQKMLPNYGYIDPNTTIAETYRLFNALPKPPLENWVGLPKLHINGVSYIVDELSRTPLVNTQQAATTLHDAQSILNSTSGSFTIEDVGSKKMFKIRVLDGFIIVKRLLTMEGEEVSPDTFANDIKLRCSGQQGVDSVLYERSNFKVPNLVEALASEHYASWQTEHSILSLFPEALPSPFLLSTFRPQPKILQQFAINIPNKNNGLEGSESEGWIPIIILCYLYRRNSYNDCAIGYTNTDSKTLTDDLQFNLPFIPVRLKFDPRKNLSDILSELSQQIEGSKKRKILRKDFFYRYPKLISLSKLDVVVVTGAKPTGLLAPIQFFVDLHERENTTIKLEVQGTANPKEANDLLQNLGQVIIQIRNQLTTIFTQPAYNIYTLSNDQEKAIKLYGNLNVDRSTSCSDIKFNAMFNSLLNPAQMTSSAKFSLDTLALVTSHNEISYGLFLKKIDYWCYWLKKLNRKNASEQCCTNPLIKIGDTVGVCVGSDMLGVLLSLSLIRIGCVVLPLSVSATSKTLLSIVTRVNPPLIITDNKTIEGMLKDSLIEIDVPQFECISSRAGDYDDFKSPMPTRDVSLSDSRIVCRLPTSGTTGMPKIVNITLVNLRASMFARCEYYATKSSIRTLLLVSSSFDTWWAVVLWPLLTNGTLYFIDDSDLHLSYRSDPEKIVNLIKKNSITHLVCVPALYEKILNYAALLTNSEEWLSTLELVILGGDVAFPELIRKHKKIATNSQLNAEYGLTECTIFTTSTVLYAPTRKGNFTNTEQFKAFIGTPVGNNQVILLDEYDYPVSPGLIGEIVIMGPQVSSGYYTDAGNCKFRQISLLGKQHWAYYTGDLAYLDYYSTGKQKQFIFVGRKDHWLKRAGVFVNPEDIGETLQQHENIQQAVVVVNRFDSSADVRIIAFVKLVPGTHVTVNDLIHWCQNHLSSSQQPNTIILKEAFSYTANQKIDRDALMRESLKMLERGQEDYVMPESSLENTLANVIAEILFYDKIGKTDNFFNLGLDSLKALSLVEKFQSISKDYKNVSVLDLYTYPTVEKLAQHITTPMRHFFDDAIDKDLDIIYSSLPAKIADFSIRNQSPGKRGILLLGATGSLGSYVLRFLLNDSSVNKVTVAVRSDKKWIEWKKIYGQSLLDTTVLNKCESIIADIGDADFLQKVSNEHYSIIINCAGEVAHVKPYAELRKVNILGVKKIIELSVMCDACLVHVSTLSCTFPDTHGTVLETLEIPTREKVISHLKLLDSYNQSKYVAELFLRKSVQTQQLKSIVVRPSWLLMPRIAIFDNHHYRDLVTGLISAGFFVKCFPQVNAYLDGAPVDDIAKVIVNLALHDVDEGIYNLNSKAFGYRLDKIFNKIMEVTNTHAWQPTIPLRTWLEELRIKLPQSHLMQNYITLLNQQLERTGIDWQSEDKANEILAFAVSQVPPAVRSTTKICTTKSENKIKRGNMVIESVLSGDYWLQYGEVNFSFNTVKS